MPSHAHTSKVVVGSGAISGFGYIGDQNVTSRALQGGDSAGGDGAHNNLQPSTSARIIIKY